MSSQRSAATVAGTMDKPGSQMSAGIQSLALAQTISSPDQVLRRKGEERQALKVNTRGSDGSASKSIEPYVMSHNFRSSFSSSNRMNLNFLSPRTPIQISGIASPMNVKNFSLIGTTLKRNLKKSEADKDVLQVSLTVDKKSQDGGSSERKERSIEMHISEQKS